MGNLLCCRNHECKMTPAMYNDIFEDNKMTPAMYNDLLEKDEHAKPLMHNHLLVEKKIRAVEPKKKKRFFMC